MSVTGGSSVVPVKKMSAEGGDYIAWSRDGKSVTWAWGAKFYRQAVKLTGEAGTDKPESFDIVVEMARPKPKGVVVLSGARVITMKGDEVIEKGDIVITDNRITEIAVRQRQGDPPGGRQGDRCDRQDDHPRSG